MDDIRPILRLIGTLAMLGAGLFSLLAPRTGARLAFIELPTSRGVTEFRVLGGGFFVGLGVWALLANNSVAYHLLVRSRGWWDSLATSPKLNGRFYRLLDAGNFDGAVFAGVNAI